MKDCYICNNYLRNFISINIKFYIIFLGFFSIIFYSNIILAEDFDDDFFELEDEEYPAKSNKINDPFENFNRKIFYFNEGVDKYLMRPINKGYRFITPSAARKSINNFYSNLSRPFDVINSLLQLDFDNAMASMSSFVINSSIGLLGVFDISRSKNIKFQERDFASTFAKYNISQGPYLVLPLLGPSDVRDFSGSLLQRTIDPLSFNALKISGKGDIIEDSQRFAFNGLEVIDKYDQIADILEVTRKDSFDLYAVMRTAYLQSNSY